MGNKHRRGRLSSSHSRGRERERELWTNAVILQKIEYIHNNPVRAGMVTEAHYYLYSSACLDSPLKVLRY